MIEPNVIDYSIKLILMLIFEAIEKEKSTRVYERREGGVCD